MQAMPEPSGGGGGTCGKRSEGDQNLGDLPIYIYEQAELRLKSLEASGSIRRRICLHKEEVAFHPPASTHTHTIRANF